MKFHEILYVSTLAPTMPVTAVAGILAGARAFNKANGITGLLVFDGTRFAHFLEGARDTVFELVERIRADARNINLEVLHYAETAERRFNRFTMAYVPVEHEQALGQLEAMDGAAAMKFFIDLIPVLDLER